MEDKEKNVISQEPIEKTLTPVDAVRILHLLDAMAKLKYSS